MCFSQFVLINEMIYYHFLVTCALPSNSVCHFTGSFHSATLKLRNESKVCLGQNSFQFPCKKLVRLVSRKRCLLIKAIIQSNISQISFRQCI